MSREVVLAISAVSAIYLACAISAFSDPAQENDLVTTRLASLRDASRWRITYGFSATDYRHRLYRFVFAYRGYLSAWMSERSVDLLIQIGSLGVTVILTGFMLRGAFAPRYGWGRATKLMPQKDLLYFCAWALISLAQMLAFSSYPSISLLMGVLALAFSAFFGLSTFGYIGSEDASSDSRN